jgi:hypothetical protein
MVPDFRGAPAAGAAEPLELTLIEKITAYGRYPEKAAGAAQNATGTYGIRSLSAAYTAVSAE